MHGRAIRTSCSSMPTTRTSATAALASAVALLEQTWVISTRKLDPHAGRRFQCRPPLNRCTRSRRFAPAQETDRAVFRRWVWRTGSPFADQPSALRVPRFRGNKTFGAFQLLPDGSTSLSRRNDNRPRNRLSRALKVYGTHVLLGTLGARTREPLSLDYVRGKLTCGWLFEERCERNEQQPHDARTWRDVIRRRRLVDRRAWCGARGRAGGPGQIVVPS